MLNIIQWGTGTTGQHALRAVHNAPGMKIVGCYTTSDHKHGRDAGEICGIGTIGVPATQNQSEILAIEADCVLYMTLEEFGLEKPVAEICRLLESGKNVVSTAATALIYPKAAGEGIAERIAAACLAGGSSFHATGIEPGWAGDVLPLALSAVLGKIDSLLIQEILDYADYPSPVSMFELMSFGKPAQAVPPTSLGAGPVGAFGAPLHMLADAFGATIEDVVFEQDIAIAEESYDIAAGRIESGTLAGKRYSFTAIINGEPKIKIEHITRAGIHIAPDWPQGQGWYITSRGQPSIKLSAEIAFDGGIPPVEGCVAAAMHVFNSIDPVCRAAPGIQTFLDLPMIVAKGALH